MGSTLSSPCQVNPAVADSVMLKREGRHKGRQSLCAFILLVCWTNIPAKENSRKTLGSVNPPPTLVNQWGHNKSQDEAYDTSITLKTEGIYGNWQSGAGPSGSPLPSQWGLEALLFIGPAMGWWLRDERWLKCEKCFMWIMVWVKIPSSKWAVPGVCSFKPILDDGFSKNLVMIERNDPVVGNMLLPLPLTN